jgi:hypothetical protein
VTAAGVGWAAFATAAPELAAAGRRLLTGADGVSIGFLATLGADGAPRLCPVCPIFCADDLYLSAGAHTPKVAQLRARADYVLHAFLGASDEEFSIAGRAVEVLDAAEHAAVVAAIPFGAYSGTDPIFRFAIGRAHWVTWERVGQPGTRPIHHRWRAPTR